MKEALFLNFGAIYCIGKNEFTYTIHQGDDMNQLINMKLHAELYYAAAMIKTMKLCNGLCNDIAPIAFKMGTANIRTISDACYRIMREKHGLPSQMIVRAIARVAGRLAEDKTKIPHFDHLEKIIYDNKLLTFKRIDEVSIMTVEGRLTIPMTVLGYRPAERERPRGYSELAYRDDNFYLSTAVKIDAV